MSEDNTQNKQDKRQGKLKYLYENYYLLKQQDTQNNDDDVIKVKAKSQVSKYISKASSKLLERNQDTSNKIRKITVSGAGNAIPNVVKINSTILEKLGDNLSGSSISSNGSISKQIISRTYIPKYEGLDNVEWKNEIHILSFEITFDQGQLTEEELIAKTTAITTNPRKQDGNSYRQKEGGNQNRRNYDDKQAGSQQRQSNESGEQETQFYREKSRDTERSYNERLDSKQRETSRDRRGSDRRRNQDESHTRDSRDTRDARDARGQRANSAVRRGGDRKRE